jgi:AmmeMemoRadiSam system protein B
LPFIARFAPHAKVTGIALGNASLAECQEFAAGLARVLDEEREKTLLVISSDMNHFARDDENRRLDAIALAAFERLDPEELFRIVREHQISMCGLIPAVIVLMTLRHWGLLSRCRRAGYATSADAGGDKSRVVGYAGMLIG